MRVVQSQDDPASQQGEEVGKLQEDRSKAVVAKAIPEATKAAEKASTEAQSSTVRSSRRKRRHAVQPNEQSDRTIQEVNRSEITVHSREGRVIEDVKANMLQGIMQSASGSESDDADEGSDEDEGRKSKDRMMMIM